MWLAAVVATAAGALVALAPWRTHDVFGDDAVHMAEWQLTRAVTVGGPQRPQPASELDAAIADFLGEQAGDLQVDDGGDSAGREARTSDDFCPT